MSRTTYFCTKIHFQGVHKRLFAATCEAWDQKYFMYTYIQLKMFDRISYSTFSRNRFIPYKDVTYGWTDTSSHL
jgi:hypothetical protein